MPAANMITAWRLILKLLSRIGRVHHTGPYQIQIRVMDLDPMPDPQSYLCAAIGEHHDLVASMGALSPGVHHRGVVDLRGTESVRARGRACNNQEK